MVRKLLRDVGRLGLFSVLVAGCGPSESIRPAMDDQATALPTQPPNIVVFVTNELSDVAGFGALAKTGARFAVTRSLSIDPAPSVFATTGATQSALLTGVPPDTLGLSPQTHDLSAIPPSGVKSFPELLRRAGYYTVRIGEARHTLSPLRVTAEREFGQPGLIGAWDLVGSAVDWRREPDEPCTVSFGCGGYPDDPDSPFFVMVNVDGTPSAVSQTVSRVLASLQADGLGEDTAVVALGVHGQHVEAIVRWPGRVEAGTVFDDPVSVLDVAPSLLALAGIPVPAYMDGGGPLTRTVAPFARARAAGPWDGAPTPRDGAPPVAATPDGYPTGGVFHVAPRVDLSCETEDGTIIYTTERVAPFRWRLYTGPFRMRFWTLRFQCGRLGYRDSEVVTYNFDIE